MKPKCVISIDDDEKLKFTYCVPYLVPMHSIAVQPDIGIVLSEWSSSTSARIAVHGFLWAVLQVLRFECPSPHWREYPKSIRFWHEPKFKTICFSDDPEPHYPYMIVACLLPNMLNNSMLYYALRGVAYAVLEASKLISQEAS